MKDVINKFKFKNKAVEINAPSIFTVHIAELGFLTSFSPDEKSRNILVFINNRS
jgi:hypothetical protein